MPSSRYSWIGDRWRTPGRSDYIPGFFIPGVTQPFYEVTNDFSGSKNVGNLPSVPLTTYTGTITDGIAVLSDGQTYSNMYFPCAVELRNGEKLRNCRIVVPASYIRTTDSVKACVRVLTGSNNTGATLEDCEIHNRSQRPLNGIAGRNTYISRSVFTGVVDAFSTSSGSDAPQNFGFVINDCAVPETAWWYSPTVNTDIHTSDTQSHNDGLQHGFASLPVTITNTTIGMYCSEIIGTGTPGSGSDAGNSYVPPNYNYIASQSQMETWKDTYGSLMTTASQTMGGVSKRIPSQGGSMAALMINREGVTADKCYIGGGLVGVNLLDSNLPTSMNVTIKNCIFYNDMRNGHASNNPVNKGHAVLLTSGKSLTSFTNNKWFDGTSVSITYL